MKPKLSSLLPMLMLALMLIPPLPARAALAPQGTTFIVNSVFDLSDPLPANGVCEVVSGDPSVCTLRAAIQTANATPEPDTITFAASLPSPAVFLLSRMGNDDTALNGDLDITADLTLIGSGVGQTILDGNGLVLQDRVLHIIGATVNVMGVTIQNGRAPDGGGLYNGGVLTVAHSAISGNRAMFVGGGLYNTGVLTVTQSTISGNASDQGGGVYVNGPVWLDQSTVHGNNATLGGGGLYNQNALTITNSTVYGNQASRGGGVQNPSGANLWSWNSTIDGNSVNSDGGGLLNSGVANLYNVTISHNVADNDDTGSGTGGGVFNFPSAVFNTRNTMLVVNYRGLSPLLNDCYGQIWSDHSRFTSVPVGCSIVGPSSFTTDPNGIGPLADNGGPTLTVALLTGSDAIDAADPVQGCVNFNSVLTTDQRGAARVAGVRCDVGAYEFGSLLPALFLPLVMR
jgi:CSLREA domain-containing protein